MSRNKAQPKDEQWLPEGFVLPQEERAPISEHTGQTYDPRWAMHLVPLGQSNRALIALMKTIEWEIKRSISMNIPENLPDGYETIKDRALPVWYVLYQGFFINEHDDHPYKFDSEEAARKFCQRHNQEHD